MRLLCDGSLGGLARWLRAAGYPAEWRRGQGGESLLGEAESGRFTLLTTDQQVMRRRRVQDGLPTVVCVPSRLTRFQQLALVLAKLDLKPQEPRCMGCGGSLRPVDKVSVATRIPPRTAAWREDYFLCEGCGKLFWEGTHWARIAARLRDVSAS